MIAGKNSFGNRLSESEWVAAISDYKSGMSGKAVGRKYGVTDVAVLSRLRRNNINRRTAAESCQLAIDHHAFDFLTPESKYWAGFLFADGCILRRDGEPKGVALTLCIADRSHVEKFRRFLQSEHGINEQTQVGGFGDGKRSCSFSFTSHRIAQRLADLGMAKKNADRCPSIELCSSPDFWRGVVDGDGYVSRRRGPRGSKTFSCVGLVGWNALVNAFRNYCISVVPECSSTAIQPKGTIVDYRLVYGNAAAIIKHLYCNATVSLDRKQSIANSIIEWTAGMVYPQNGWVPFSELEDRIIRENIGKISIHKIGMTCGRAPAVIYKRAKRMGIAWQSPSRSSK
jgi:hypothetical protein